jgi:glycosyltransferase involved in cell wall biosynthesis
MPLIKAGEMTLELVGDGPERENLQKVIDRDGLASGVKLAGWVEHSQLPARLAEADILTFPSIHEFGGAVVLEAMAVGVVPVVVNYGGPGDLVTEKTGFTIPLGNRAGMVLSLRSILADLASHPEKIEAKSAAARQRAPEQFSWESKARQVRQVYEWVCRPETIKPQFPMPTGDLAD